MAFGMASAGVAVNSSGARMATFIVKIHIPKYKLK
jgi:hypothetical protein